MLPSVLGACRQCSAGAFEIRGSDDLLRDLMQDELDLVIALGDIAALEARHRWMEPLAWACAPGLAFNRATPLPLVLAREAGEIARLATAALERNGTAWQAACRVPREACAAAVAAGIGIAAVLGRFAPELAVCEDPRLPRLPELACGIHVRDGAAEARVEQLADRIAEALQPAIAAPSAIPPAIEEPATQLQTEH